MVNQELYKLNEASLSAFGFIKGSAVLLTLTALPAFVYGPLFQERSPITAVNTPNTFQVVAINRNTSEYHILSAIAHIVDEIIGKQADFPREIREIIAKKLWDLY